MKKALISLNPQTLDKTICVIVYRLHDDGRYLIPTDGYNGKQLLHPNPCYVCGGEEYWATFRRRYECCWCHPQPRKVLMAIEVTGLHYGAHCNKKVTHKIKTKKEVTRMRTLMTLQDLIDDLSDDGFGTNQVYVDPDDVVKAKRGGGD